MYKHLLVPVDDTPLGAELMGDAIDLARLLSARVTFLHVTGADDASAYGDAAVVRATDPGLYREKYQWAARAVLARAEAAARAVGIEHASVSQAGHTPLHESILETAHTFGCDLIVMGSHERGSRLARLMSSTAVSVVTRTPVPFLLAIPGVGGPAPRRHATARIRDEHRTIAAVVEGLRRIAAESGAAPLAGEDERIARGALRFLVDFAGRLHHPKEEDYLFARLRLRDAGSHAHLTMLEQQHAAEAGLVADVQEALDGQTEGGPSGLLSQRVEALARHMWRHMSLEEDVILPQARACLSEQDWAEIDDAFAGHTDPRFGAENEQQLRSMYSRLANLLPV